MNMIDKTFGVIERRIRLEAITDNIKTKRRLRKSFLEAYWYNTEFKITLKGRLYLYYSLARQKVARFLA